jgi:hypothetical protein
MDTGMDMDIDTIKFIGQLAKKERLSAGAISVV